MFEQLEDLSHWLAHSLKKVDASVYFVDNARAAEKPTTVWESKIKEVMWAYDDGHPRYRHDKWRDIFDGQLSSTPFTILSADPIFSLPLGEDHTKWTVWLSRDAVWERFHTMSHISVLEGEELVVGFRK